MFTFRPLFRAVGRSDSKSQSVVSSAVTATDSLPQPRRIRHSPLKDATTIRLIALHKGEGDNEICGELMQARMHSIPPYECLSYVWGQPQEQDEIYFNGESFSVTSNLYNALRRLRHPDRVRLLWIDQICIDQTNISERSLQVQMMGNIYRGAGKVLIWLGEAGNDSDLAFDFIELLVRTMRQLRPGESIMSHNVTDLGLPSWPSRPWFALAHLLARPWFQRSWTVQECVLAREARVHCGEKTMPWTALETLLLGRRLEAHPIFLSCMSLLAISGNVPARTALRQVSAIFQERLMLSRSLAARDMADVLRSYRDCFSTDHRDKLFAFLGCMSNATRNLYSPADYSRTLEEVYTEVAIVSLTTFRSLGVLTHGGIGTQQHRLPSWVPDWSVQARGFTLDYNNYKSIDQQKAMGAPTIIPLYNASRGSRPSFALSAEHNILNVTGKIIGRIAAVGEHLRFEKGTSLDASESFQESATRHLLYGKMSMQQCFEMAAHCNPYPSGGSHLSAVRMTLVGGMTPSWARTSPAEVDRNFQAYDQAVSQLLNPGQNQGQDEQVTEEKSRMMSTIGFAFEEVALDRAFAVTEEKYVGLVPVRSKSGDWICIILGCATPFILREDDDKYALIGESYIHGLMDGEAMSMGQYPLQDIALK